MRESTIADLVKGNPPDAIAFHAPDATLTWREYDDLSSGLAQSYLDKGWRKGDRLAVMLTGGALTHVAYLAAQKAGLVTVGLGPRAGDAEVTHVLRHTKAVALATRRDRTTRPAAQAAPSRTTTVASSTCHHSGTSLADGESAGRWIR